MKMATKLKSRLFFLRLFSFIFSVGPLAVILIHNADEYIATVSDAVKLSLGGVLIVVFLILKAMGKLAIPRRITGYAIAFGMCYLFASVLADMLLITGAALLGEVIDYVIFQPWIKRTKEQLVIEKSADATADKLEGILESYLGGRV